jgi:hypothetical protein
MEFLRHLARPLRLTLPEISSVAVQCLSSARDRCCRVHTVIAPATPFQQGNMSGSLRIIVVDGCDDTVPTRPWSLVIDGINFIFAKWLP